MRSVRRPSFEAIPIRLYFHCGWAIQVDPSFECEMVEGGETLRMFDPGEKREISLSSMIYRRTDGKPFKAEDVLDVFPPREMAGLHYEHKNGGLAGRALWMLGESDDVPRPSWVLMAVMVSASAGKIARCTVVCEEEKEREWALDAWRSIVRLKAPPGAETVGRKG